MIKKCITVTEVQDEKIRAIQIRLMAGTRKTVSYSFVLQQAINQGLEKLQ